MVRKWRQWLKLQYNQVICISDAHFYLSPTKYKTLCASRNYVIREYKGCKMDSVCVKNLCFNHIRSHEMLNNNKILILTIRRSVLIQNVIACMMNFIISINFKRHRDQFWLNELYETHRIWMFQKQRILIWMEGESKGLVK